MYVSILGKPIITYDDDEEDDLSLMTKPVLKLPQSKRDDIYGNSGNKDDIYGNVGNKDDIYSQQQIKHQARERTFIRIPFTMLLYSNKLKVYEIVFVLHRKNNSLDSKSTLIKLSMNVDGIFSLNYI